MNPLVKLASEMATKEEIIQLLDKTETLRQKESNLLRIVVESAQKLLNVIAREPHYLHVHQAIQNLKVDLAKAEAIK